MEPSSFQTARPPAALTATPRFDDGALAPQLMPATIRRPAMMETHPTASQSAERTTPPLRGRGLRRRAHGQHGRAQHLDTAL